ncbi:MAG: carboxypeptidase-like regulatory domain-containing protein [Solirubrobacteraceae bacterium]|jgi:hypothetical protein
MSSERLTRFGDELEHAIGRELAARAADVTPTRRRRRPVRSGLVLATAAVAVAVAVVAIVSSLASTAGEPAWAKQIMQRAADVLAPAPSPHTILHVVATQTESPMALRDGPSVSFLSEEGWLQQGPPWHSRVIVHPAGGPVLERESTGQTYNMTSNELYPEPQLPSGKPRYTLLPGVKPGSYRLRVKMPHGFYTRTIDSTEAKAIRDGTQALSWAITWNGHVQQLQALVMPSSRQLQQAAAQQPDASSLTFAAQLHGLLSSGHARVTRATTADGKPAIEIASVNPQSGPRTTYYVNPTTYAPIEVDRYGYWSPKDVTRVRFSVYQTLPLAGHQRLLRFTIPPNARIDHTPADYYRWLVLTPF